MRLALNTLMWAWEPFASVLDYARDLRIYDLDLGALPGGCGHLDPPAPDPEDRCAGLVALLPPAGRFVAVTADHPDLSSSDAEARRVAVAYTLSAMHAARLLGATVVGTSLGSVGEGREWRDAAARATESLREVMQASPENIHLAIEVHVNDVCNSLPKACHFIEAVADERLEVAFDTSLLFHNHIDIDDAFEALGERLFHVHLRGATEETYFAIPGRDAVDFRRFFDRLRGIGYEGAMSLELYEVEQRYGISTVEALREAIPYLLECGAAG